MQGVQPGGESGSSKSDKQKESAEARESKIEIIMKIRRRSVDDIKVEGFKLNDQQNNIRKVLRVGKDNLRRSRAWLKELRDNAPPPNVSISRSPSLTELGDVLRSVSAWLKKHRKKAPPSNRPAPRTRRNIQSEAILATIQGSLDVIGSVKSLQDSKLHAKLVANQKQTVSELEQQVDALEKQDHEIQAQVGDKERERKSLPPEK